MSPRTQSNGIDEEQPLLGRQPKASFRKKLTADVNRNKADLILLLCYIITGMLDSIAILTWGSFVSMQTGNTVYIGLGIASPSASTRWIKSLTSVVAFCVGSFCFSRFHRAFSPSRRWVLCASFIVQALLVVAAAAILRAAPSDAETLDWTVLLPIALIAFQSCGQAVVSRALNYNTLTSVVLTSIYCDLFSDAELFVAHNYERNRRMSAPLLLLLGAALGGWLTQSAVGAAGALWIAAGIKLCVAVTWFFWPAAN